MAEMKTALVVGVLAFVVGCKSKDACKETERSVTPGAASFTWSQCSDGHDRHVGCTSTTSAWSCTCALAGKDGATFQLPLQGAVSTELVTPAIAKDKCGWTL